MRIFSQRTNGKKQRSNRYLTAQNAIRNNPGISYINPEKTLHNAVYVI